MRATQAIPVRQPWAWLIGAGLKPIENKSGRFHYRGPIYIHATLTLARTPLEEIEQRFHVRIPRAELHRGGIVALVTLSDVVTSHPSPYFEGPFGWVLTNARHVPFEPIKGNQGIINVPEEALKRLEQAQARKR